MSDAIPNLHKVADELCVIRSMNTTNSTMPRPSCWFIPVRHVQAGLLWGLGNLRFGDG
jgi:hypothetical protein